VAKLADRLLAKTIYFFAILASNLFFNLENDRIIADTLAFLCYYNQVFIIRQT